MHDGGAPAAEMLIGQMELHHAGMLCQNRVNRPPQLPDALAVNDPHPQNPARPARGEIIEHQVFHLARLKRVQVQHPVNRQLDRLFIHHGS